jgi:hypothetical protein
MMVDGLPRKGIPEEVREEDARLYRVKREAHLKLHADTPRHGAKVRLRAVLPTPRRPEMR